VAAAKEGPGGALQAARQARKLSVSQVADRLRLSSAVVMALEANDWERLPAPVFVRGYVRAYARLIGLPAEELLDNDYSAIVVEAKGKFSAMQTLESRRGSVLWASLLRELRKYMPATLESRRSSVLWAAGAISALAVMVAALVMLSD